MSIKSIYDLFKISVNGVVFTFINLSTMKHSHFKRFTLFEFPAKFVGLPNDPLM